MSVNPHLRFFISDPTKPIGPESLEWNLPLPVKKENKELAAKTPVSQCVTYGDYFGAARTFLTKNNFEIISAVLSNTHGVCPEDIGEINISLEKHGSIYHPSKIKAVAKNMVYTFVLNVAVSTTGIECIHREFNTLSRLNSAHPNKFIPAVYSEDELCNNKNHRIGMFLGEWFEGYSEFHISKDPSDGKEKILLWDGIYDNRFVAPNKSMEIYRQATIIMTWFYNIHTFEQIFPWHHAAGDFVVKESVNSLDVKLITARQYAPLYETETQNKDNDVLFDGLLIFLIVLSIRMRLDRIDGTGDFVWADRPSVEGTIRGLFDGLSLKKAAGNIPRKFIDAFRTYLKTLSRKDLSESVKKVISSFNPSAPDMQIIHEKISQHSDELFLCINNAKTD